MLTFLHIFSLNNGIDGLPSHIEFQGGAGPGSRLPGHSQQLSQAGLVRLPNLKPDEQSGRCVKYTGQACAKVNCTVILIMITSYN